MIAGFVRKCTKQEDAIKQAVEIKNALNIGCVVVHATRYAVGCDNSEEAIVQGSYCEKPIKSTGAGDRFNAGYILGCLMECSLENRLTLATATSSYFVRNAKSPTIEALAQFIEDMT